MQTEALYQSLLSAFKLQRADQDDDATTARALTDILVAFAGVIASAGTTSATLATVVGSNEPILSGAQQPFPSPAPEPQAASGYRSE